MTQAPVAILLAAYGSTHPQALCSQGRIEERIRALWPDFPVRWAVTSAHVRDRMRRRNQAAPSVEEALDELCREGFARVAVQSLHTVPGEEYRRTLEAAAAAACTASVGAPLLFSPADIKAAAAALPAYLGGLPEPGSGRTLVLIGHGSHLPEGQRRYRELQDALANSSPDVLLGTLLGEPGRDAVRAELARRAAAGSVSRVTLAPFMSVPGHHLRKDIDGDSPKSWRTAVESLGLPCEAILTGTTACDAFIDIWLEHLAAAVAAG